MQDKLDFLFAEKIITTFEKMTFIIFEISEEGRKYLKDAMEASFMEEPACPAEELFAWHDGRKSVYRDIRRIIDKVYENIEKLREVEQNVRPEHY